MAVNSRGFTLIELLVVMSIMTVIGVIGLDIFSSVLRGSNKANVVNEVKENGQQALDVMERYIRNAQTVSVPNDKELNLTVNNGTVIFKCDLGVTPNGKITMKIGSDSVRDLTNTHPQSGVDVNSCTLTQTGGGTAPKVIKIDLVLDQGAQASTRKEFQANVKLSTTVSLRTY